ncbi:Uma2 family endonuclease [Candidatus Synechococcus calcipolaris G9]|uniref:Uma2 family endonuclease n=1 Tax=Candidatus Synechococcus calcipolaris G9 TaxID=1497997 RepID=A0ABT6EWR4_9SYNE|nr:Uma2 family endonuclease [Candidatus Synechococcus calcipolaris]MDG2990210.1 Uma2 family endonuclease [Candidatus Synechococcus calcipolaris G9]
MALSVEPTIHYPDSDGQPMADNTRQFRWIVLLKENLECLFANDPNVFVAGDLLWYPVEGRPDIRVAPDVMVIFGRPKGDRGSYQQWLEAGITPQVVFEILSPGNRLTEMVKKLQFYDRHGVEEYYIYDPDLQELSILVRTPQGLDTVEMIDHWRSPRLGIEFVLGEDDLEVYYPDGRRFLTTIELAQQIKEAQQRAEQEAFRAQQETQRAEQEALRAQQETQRAEQEALRAEQETQRADRLAAYLRSQGIDPEQI